MEEILHSVDDEKWGLMGKQQMGMWQLQRLWGYTG